MAFNPLPSGPHAKAPAAARKSVLKKSTPVGVQKPLLSYSVPKKTLDFFSATALKRNIGPEFFQTLKDTVMTDVLAVEQEGDIPLTPQTNVLLTALRDFEVEVHSFISFIDQSSASTTGTSRLEFMNATSKFAKAGVSFFSTLAEMELSHLGESRLYSISEGMLSFGGQAAIALIANCEFLKGLSPEEQSLFQEKGIETSTFVDLYHHIQTYQYQLLPYTSEIAFSGKALRDDFHRTTHELQLANDVAIVIDHGDVIKPEGLQLDDYDAQIRYVLDAIAHACQPNDDQDMSLGTGTIQSELMKAHFTHYEHQGGVLNNYAAVRTYFDLDIVSKGYYLSEPKIVQKTILDPQKGMLMVADLSLEIKSLDSQETAVNLNLCVAGFFDQNGKFQELTFSHRGVDWGDSDGVVVDTLSNVVGVFTSFFPSETALLPKQMDVDRLSGRRTLIPDVGKTLAERHFFGLGEDDFKRQQLFQE